MDASNKPMIIDPNVLVQCLVTVSVALAVHIREERRDRERPAAPVVVLSLEQAEIVLRAEQGRPSPEAEALQAGLAAFRRTWEETLAFSRTHPPTPTGDSEPR